MPHNFTPEESKEALERRQELALMSKNRAAEAAKRAREGRKQLNSSENSDAMAPTASASTIDTPRATRPNSAQLAAQIEQLTAENAELRVFLNKLCIFK